MENTPELHFETALQRIRDRLRLLPHYTEKCGEWPNRFPVEFLIQHGPKQEGRTWALMIPRNAPFELPRLAIRCSDPNDLILTHPHVEDRKTGLLCLARTEEVTANPELYTDTCLHLLRRGVEFAKADWSLKGESEFQFEWLSYWSRDAASGMPPIYISAEISDFKKSLSAVSTKAGWIISNNEASINRVGVSLGIKPGKYETRPVPVLLLEDPLTPKQFPNTFEDVRNLFMDHQQDQEFDRCVQVNGTHILIWLVVCIANSSYSIAGGRLDMRPAPSYQGTGSAYKFHRNPKHLCNGFRRMPPVEVRNKRLSSIPCGRCSVERFDHAWIHGRQHDRQSPIMKEARIAIFGAGSLGSGIAELLVKAGIGEIHLIDNDTMKPENSSRHTLGCETTNKKKSLALADRLNQHDPSIKIIGYSKLGQDWIKEEGGALIERLHLIIDATGDWQFSSFLNSFMISRKNSMPPVLWTWLEAHCLAAHAALTSYPEGCIQCVLQNDGAMRHAILKPFDFTVNVAACGGTFQPYGSTNLAAAHSLAADLAIESLIDPELYFDYRVWVSGKKKIRNVKNAVISEEWLSQQGETSELPYIARPHLQKCTRCNKGNS